MSGLVEVVPVRVPGTYEILGSDMQILNMEAGKLGKITANPGSMTYMAPSVKMSTNCNNPFGRCMSKESCIQSEFEGDGFLGLTPSFPAKVVPLNLGPGNGFRVKTGAFFASFGNAVVNFDIDCNPLTCCCAGQGCVRQSIQGDGTAFIAAMGTLMTKELAAGEKLVIDTNSLVAWSENVKLDVRLAGGCCTICCGGEGLFNTVLEGPGTIYVQSMSYEKFKHAMTVFVQQEQKKKGGAPPEGEEMER